MPLRVSPPAVVLVLLAAGALLGGCGGRAPTVLPTPSPATPSPPSPPTPSPTAAPTPAALPPLSLEEGRLSGAVGEIRWDLSAGALDVDAERGEVRLTRVEARFFERGALVVTLGAASGVYDQATRNVTLAGQVRARAQGRALEAARVEWLAARRLLVATGSVRFIQERMTVRADRLESDIALRTAKLTGNVRVTVRE